MTIVTYPPPVQSLLRMQRLVQARTPVVRLCLVCQRGMLR